MSQIIMFYTKEIENRGGNCFKCWIKLDFFLLIFFLLNEFRTNRKKKSNKFSNEKIIMKKKKVSGFYNVFDIKYTMIFFI